jgi:hypothetical protein
MRTSALGALGRYLGYPRVWISGTRAHAKLGCEDKLDRANWWLACMDAHAKLGCEDKLDRAN